MLLLGLSDSGKTLIFAQLLHRKFVQTHTSVKENIGDFVSKNVSSYLQVTVQANDTELIHEMTSFICSFPQCVRHFLIICILFIEMIIMKIKMVFGFIC